MLTPFIIDKKKKSIWFICISIDKKQGLRACNAKKSNVYYSLISGNKRKVYKHLARCKSTMPKQKKSINYERLRKAVEERVGEPVFIRNEVYRIIGNLERTAFDIDDTTLRTKLRERAAVVDPTKLEGVDPKKYGFYADKRGRSVILFYRGSGVFTYLQELDKANKINLFGYNSIDDIINQGLQDRTPPRQSKNE